jgi:hypothetical protein
MYYLDDFLPTVAPSTTDGKQKGRPVRKRKIAGAGAGGSELAFSKAASGQLWVPLLEKAYAKVRVGLRASRLWSGLEGEQTVEWA